MIAPQQSTRVKDWRTSWKSFIINELTRKHQISDGTVLGARVPFKKVLENYLQRCARLSSTAPIFQNNLFESAIGKVQKSQESTMADVEQREVECILLPRTETCQHCEQSFSFVMRAAKRFCTTCSSSSHYEDTRLLVPTSTSMCEWFSSIAF